MFLTFHVPNLKREVKSVLLILTQCNFCTRFRLFIFIQQAFIVHSTNAKEPYLKYLISLKDAPPYTFYAPQRPIALTSKRLKKLSYKNTLGE